VSPDGTGWKAGVVAVTALVVGSTALIKSIGPLTIYHRSAMRGWIMDQVERRHGQIPLAAEYVGIAYSDEVWSVNGDTSWDQGALEVGDQSLVFLGRKSQFELPVRLITSVRLQPTPLLCSRPTPRILIGWTAPDGSAQHVAIETRDANNRRSLEAETETLQQRVVRGWNSPSTDSYLPSLELPVKRADLPLREPDIYFASSAAKAMAGAATIATIFLTQVLITLIQRFLNTRWEGGVSGGVVGLLGLFLYGYYTVRIDRWLKARKAQRLQAEPLKGTE
jgi:hypothetical protein